MAKPQSPPNPYHHGDLKSSLILAANKLLQQHGAESLSIRAIAAEAQVSHMAPYAHFKNKRELLQAVAAAGFRAMVGVMVKAAEQERGRGELILAYGHAYLEFAVTHSELYRLMLGQIETRGRKQADVGLAGQISVELEQSSNQAYQLLAAVFEQYLDDQEQIKAQAAGAWAIVHGLAALIIAGHIQVPEQQSLKDFFSAAQLRPDANFIK